MICMIKIEKTVDQITVENVVDVIKQKMMTLNSVNC